MRLQRAQLLWQLDRNEEAVADTDGDVLGFLPGAGEIEEGGGNLVLTRPWPAMARTLYKEKDRFIETYWDRYGRDTYLVGDAARRDEDGYFWIVGRIDDVLNVAGHRIGTAEIESTLVSHPSVAEAAAQQDRRGRLVHHRAGRGVRRGGGRRAHAVVAQQAFGGVAPRRVRARGPRRVGSTRSSDASGSARWRGRVGDATATLGRGSGPRSVSG